VTDDHYSKRRRTIRLQTWDYSADGAYFVTICTTQQRHLFGNIVDGVMRLNSVGTIVTDSWRWLASRYPYVTLDEWCLMPNHLHGILVLTGRGGSRTAPTVTEILPRKPLGRLIGAFKTVSTKHINQLRRTPGAIVWQRNFWERVVRDDVEMDRIRSYVRNNPDNWAADELNSVTGRGGSRTAPTPYSP
jgi:REP-associated tyrosine transposase